MELDETSVDNIPIKCCSKDLYKVTLLTASKIDHTKAHPTTQHLEIVYRRTVAVVDRENH